MLSLATLVPAGAASAQSGSGGDPPTLEELMAAQAAQRDPTKALSPLSALLGRMQWDLEHGVDPPVFGAILQVGEPVITYAYPTGSAVSSLDLSAAGSIVAGGSATLTLDVINGTGDSTITLTESGVTRTLTTALWVDAQPLHGWGDVTIDDGTSTTAVVGGWTYDTVAGVLEDAASDPAFVTELNTMFHVTAGGGGAGSCGICNVLTFVANVVTLGFNYIADLFVAYTPPTSCAGPLIYDSSGQSCENFAMPCKNDLDDWCLAIDDMPDVNDAFKQCIKGRCGCGGSNHPRAMVSCAPGNDCGPCTPPGLAGGCSLAGAQMWYCQSSITPTCACVNTIFHEMAHACGFFDDPTCQAPSQCPPPASEQFDEACRIGFWWEEQCCAAPGF